MKIQVRIFLIIAIQMMSGALAWSQRSNDLIEDYIEKYKDLAIYEMTQNKIPASIKLAQGILESKYGTSDLAIKAKNHFGIKKHDWTGPTVKMNDDKPNEEFRVYRSVEASYKDHSDFLHKYPRYSGLFAMTNYRDWAVGLQKAGYATNPAYANSLIALIERLELYRFDTEGYAKKSGKKTSSGTVKSRKARDVYKTFGLIYVIAGKDDSFKDIAYDMNYKMEDLVKYNDVPDENFPLNEGDMVYLEKKKKKADKPYYEHLVHPGESMHSISQFYGIQMARLYKMNKIDADYVPEDGSVLKLR